MKFLVVIGLSATLAFGGACTRRKIAQEYPAEMSTLETEGGMGLPFYVGADLRPSWHPERGPAPRSLKPFTLTDQNHRRVEAAALDHKLSVVSFFFTRCAGICPTTMGNLRKVQEAFRGEPRLNLVSFSITPETDSPETLRKYAAERKIDPDRWRLLTGDRDSIYRLARESFSADTVSPSENVDRPVTGDDFLHSEHVYLLDGQKRLRGIYLGRMDDSIQELIRDAETLLKTETL